VFVRVRSLLMVSIDYAFLLMTRDSQRVAHVDRQRVKHPYFRIMEAIDAVRDWGSVERIFIDNGVQVGRSYANPHVGKLGRWASFIQWLVDLRDNTVDYGVLVEDDVLVPADFRARLEAFIREHPERRYFRCGDYNSCLVVRQDYASEVLDTIRATKVTMPDDWWSWKAAKILRAGPITLVKQLTRYRSNIAATPLIRCTKIHKNPAMWE
jgi:hypothetical protein